MLHWTVTLGTEMFQQRSVLYLEEFVFQIEILLLLALNYRKEISMPRDNSSNDTLQILRPVTANKVKEVLVFRLFPAQLI